MNFSKNRLLFICCFLGLSRIYHADFAAACESYRDTASGSTCSSSGIEHTPLENHCLDCLDQPSWPPRHDQYDISGLGIIGIENYVFFLNCTAKSDSGGAFDLLMEEGKNQVIIRYGEPGSYFYEVVLEKEEPLYWISEHDAIGYCDWRNAFLHNKEYHLEIGVAFKEVDHELKSNLKNYPLIENAVVVRQTVLDAMSDYSLLLEDEELFIGLACLFFGTAANHSIQNCRDNHYDHVEVIQEAGNAVLTTSLLQEEGDSHLPSTHQWNNQELFETSDAVLNHTYPARLAASPLLPNEEGSDVAIPLISRRLFPNTPDRDVENSDSSDNAVTGMILDMHKIDLSAESDSSPDSSDSEYGAKTLMRKVAHQVKHIKPKNYAINQDGTEEITEEEMKANPGKFYIANFRGDYLSYFKTNRARRSYVKKAVDSVVSNHPIPFRSIAVKEIERKYPGKEERAEAFSQLNTAHKIKDSSYVKTYKSPTHFSRAVQEVSPEYGNPIISTSKDTKVSPVYADHPKDKALLLPQYSENKKPKHRLIGVTTVIVHEANEYAVRTKADIEQLRTHREIGKISAVERKNDEILFEGVIESKNIAGYVPLAYPNLSKKYSFKDKGLFGLDEEEGLGLTRSSPKTLGKKAKENTLFKANRRFQWRLAEKYVTDKNPRGELIWVDLEGNFNRFRANQDSKLYISD
ncbi:MAG: hypothetical protein QE493_00435 [Verrucomicrobiae bacterium]|nr:hypothetical protein [Verrucomicrobiae bacterium]